MLNVLSLKNQSAFSYRLVLKKYPTWNNANIDLRALYRRFWS